MPSVLVPLSSFFTHVKGEPTSIEFIDSTSIKVCHNLHIPRHKVFKGTATRGKGTMGWFYGFKLHDITNHLGDIVAAKLTLRQLILMIENLSVSYPKVCSTSSMQIKAISVKLLPKI